MSQDKKKLEYEDVLIEAVLKIFHKYNKDQVIIITWDKTHEKTNVMTYGKTLEDCDIAAQGGNCIKRFLGFPDELCHEVPDWIKDKV